MERPYLLVDAKNVAYRCFVPEETFSTKAGVRTDILHIGFKILSKLARDLRPRRIFLVWDNGPAWWRRKLVPNYKDKPLDSYMSGTKDAIDEQTPRAKEFFAKFGMINLEADGEEADDIIHRLTNVFSPCLIVSSDSDFHQLVREDVVIWEPRKRVLIDEAKVLEEDGIPAAQYALVKAIVGDKSDVIEGVKGVGWKTAAKLWAKAVPAGVVDRAEMLSLFYDSIVDEKGKRPRDIVNNWAIVKRNIALIDMGLYPLTPGIEAAVEVAKTARPRFEHVGAIEALKKYEMVSLLADHNHWVPVFKNLPDVVEE